MEAKELRIGNYLTTIHNIHENDFILEVLSISNYLNYKRIIDGVMHLNYIGYFKPIPLNEEIIVNLGFEYYKLLSVYRLVIDDVWYRIKINQNGDFIFSFTSLNYDEVNHMPPKKMEFVHKLQNLVYELSGKELKYNKSANLR